VVRASSVSRQQLKRWRAINNFSNVALELKLDDPARSLGFTVLLDLGHKFIINRSTSGNLNSGHLFCHTTSLAKNDRWNVRTHKQPVRGSLTDNASQSFWNNSDLILTFLFMEGIPYARLVSFFFPRDATAGKKFRFVTAWPHDPVAGRLWSIFPWGFNSFQK